MRRKAITVTAAIVIAATMTFGAQAGAQDTEVEYLLEFVGTSDCDFLRNGSAHSAAEAADHLRLKYRRGKKYVSNGDEFIDRLASESSWTGKPYQVNCGGSVQPSREWLQQALAEFRQQQGAVELAAPESP